ncbi:MAG: hypothetical protein IKP91_10180 [Bacteroidaceae bacterium]|nr:hypothetical protein [Bacteroidaceae bacterium]
MKKIAFSLATAFLCALSLQAQTTYEAANLLGSDLDGTARYVGMGGAMSALGADVSTIRTNPAGIALYRSCDLMATFGGVGITQKTNNFTNFQPRGTFDNIGLVIASKHSNEGVLRFVNFGFNYQKVKDFNGKMNWSGNLNGLSQTAQMAWQVYQNDPTIGDAFFDQSNEQWGFTHHNYYDDPNYGWLSLLGADGRLVDATAFNEGQFYPSSYGEYSGEEKGSISEYDFNLSFNFVDQVYLGATLGITDVYYAYNSVYREDFEDGNYTLENWYKTRGTGYNLRLGAIIRPIEESSFRIGVAASTPTFYSHLTDYNSAKVSTTLYDAGVDENVNVADVQYQMDTMSEDAFGGDCYTKYTNIAPGNVNVSLGYTLESGLALGAEWEYTDYSTVRLYEGDGRENKVINEHTKGNLCGQHTFRVGLEKKFFDSLYARLGYNYATGGYKSDAWKMIPINSVQTNTDYKNILNTNTFSGGIGFRGEVLYADLALAYSTRNADFYPFENVNLKAIPMTRNTFKGIATLGFRF